AVAAVSSAGRLSHRPSPVRSVSAAFRCAAAPLDVDPAVCEYGPAFAFPLRSLMAIANREPSSSAKHRLLLSSAPVRVLGDVVARPGKDGAPRAFEADLQVVPAAHG